MQNELDDRYGSVPQGNKREREEERDCHHHKFLASNTCQCFKYMTHQLMESLASFAAKANSIYIK